MRRKDRLSATLWDLRTQYEDELRTLSAAQRMLQEWQPGVSGTDDEAVLTAVRACFERLSSANGIIAGVLRDVRNEVEAWS